MVAARAARLAELCVFCLWYQKRDTKWFLENAAAVSIFAPVFRGVPVISAAG